jgi:hypothetical protein
MRWGALRLHIAHPEVLRGIVRRPTNSSFLVWLMHPLLASLCMLCAGPVTRAEGFAGQGVAACRVCPVDRTGEARRGSGRQIGLHAVMPRQV